MMDTLKDSFDEKVDLQPENEEDWFEPVDDQEL